MVSFKTKFIWVPNEKWRLKVKMLKTYFKSLGKLGKALPLLNVFGWIYSFRDRNSGPIKKATSIVKVLLYLRCTFVSVI